jgi:Ca2+-binding RTX toxin-like protein
MTDVWFKLDTARTIDQDLLEIDATIAAMPDLAGFGNVHSLHQALARDSSGALATLIQEFVSADRSDRAAVLDQLIFTWAGAAGVEPGSRGSLIDARKLTVLEAFMGEAYLQNNTSSTPGGGATFILNGAYDTLVTRISGQLLLQTVFKPLVDSIQLTITENRFTLDVSEVAALMQSHYDTNSDQGVADMVDFGNSLKVLGDAGTELLNNLRQLGNISGEGYELFLAHIGNLLLGDAGTNALNGSAEDEVIIGLAGNDYITGGDGDDHLEGSLGNDRLYGYNGEDVLNGGEGSDSLYGNAGNDILDGGAGYDSLDGGPGSDTYLFGRGSGQDWIKQFDAGVDKLDTIQLGADILTTDIRATRSGSSLVLSIVDTADKLTVLNYFLNDGENGYKVDAIKFADGTNWDMVTLKEKVTQGTAGHDVLQGYAIADTLNGQAGNDSIIGNAGDDILDGGEGDDYIIGGDGDDQLKGSQGNDRLYGYNGEDVLSGGEGSDSLYGGAGNDILDGGVGYDRLDGGSGSDTYLFGRGSGQDWINQYDAGDDKLDTIQLGADILESDVIVTRSHTSLELSIAGTLDKLSVINYFADEEEGGYKVDVVKFADGTSWNLAILKKKVTQGTLGNDVLQGFTTADTLSGLGGNDSIYGNAGDDTLHGNEGVDKLYGNAGNDILNGGAGNDSLDGGAGSDIYMFSRGSGQDVINQYDTSVNKQDRILLGSDISTTDIIVTRFGSSLVISIVGTADKLTVMNYFVNDGSNGYKVDEIKFADGSSWDLATIKEKVIQGTDGIDLLQGYITADTLNGQGGNDSINGNAGNDILDGGAGNDTLNGGAGSDTYLFGRGSGQDTIYNYDISVGKLDTIQLGSDISESDILATRSGSNLVLSIANTSDRLTVTNYFIYDGKNSYVVDAIKFTDGTNWDIAKVKTKVTGGSAIADFLQGSAQADTLDGLAGNDRIYGNAGNDILDGGADSDYVYGGEGDDQLEGGLGNDYLYGDNGNDVLSGSEGNDNLTGGAGNDALEGGTGNDTLNGGAGSDTYIFNLGSGHDAITDYESVNNNSQDILKFGEGISADDLWFSRKSNNLVVDHIGSDDQLQIKNWFSSINNQIEQISVENAVLHSNQVINLVNAMSAFNAPTGSGAIVPQDVQEQLAPVLATSWTPAG